MRSAKTLPLLHLATDLVLATLGGVQAGLDPFDADHWRRVFARPDHVPMPSDNPTTRDKVALGARLFEDPRLSGDGNVACATCHQAELSFTDGVPRHGGLDGQPLDRRTPLPSGTWCGACRGSGTVARQAWRPRRPGPSRTSAR